MFGHTAKIAKIADWRKGTHTPSPHRQRLSEVFCNRASCLLICFIATSPGRNFRLHLFGVSENLSGVIRLTEELVRRELQDLAL